MEISIVVPVYNAEFFLEATFQSILDQSYPNYEVIFVEDSSPDRSWELCQKFAAAYDFVRCFRLDHGGVEHARNYGVKVAKYEWIAFLDSDDRWHPHKLEKQVALITANPDVRVVSGYGTYFTDEQRNFGSLSFGPTNASEYEDLIHRKKPVWILTPTVLCHKSAFEEVGGFNPLFEGSAEDLDLWTRLAQKYPVRTIPEVLVYVRLSANSVSMKKYKKIIRNTNYIRHYLRDETPLSFAEYHLREDRKSGIAKLNEERKLFASNLFRNSGLYFLKKDYIAFISYLFLASLLSPAHVFTKLMAQIKGKLG